MLTGLLTLTADCADPLPLLGIKLITPHRLCRLISSDQPLLSQPGPGLVCNSHKNASHQIESVQGQRDGWEVKSNQISPFYPCPSGHLAAWNITCDQLFGEYLLIQEENIWESCAKTVNVMRQTILCTFIVLMRELESAWVMTWLGPQRWDEDRRECELKYMARHVIALCLEWKLMSAATTDRTNITILKFRKFLWHYQADYGATQIIKLILLDNGWNLEICIKISNHENIWIISEIICYGTILGAWGHGLCQTWL